MTRARKPRPGEPTADELAAYFDGATAGADRDRIETWLSDHPDAGRDAAFADTDDDLARAWQGTQPADPAPDTWDAVRARVAVAVSPSAGGPPRRRALGTILGAAAATAAAIGLVFLGRTLWPTHPEAGTGVGVGVDLPSVVAQIRRAAQDTAPDRKGPGGDFEESEPFLVASAGEVRVISMEGEDTFVEIDGQTVKALIGSEPPVADDVLLPTSYEKTRLVGWVDPELHFEDWGVPMVVDPAVLAKGWQPE